MKIDIQQKENGQLIAFETLSQKYKIFWGAKNSEVPVLAQEFCQLNFLSVKQSHSDQFLFQDKLDANEKPADAHSTHLLNAALCIKTADCIPIFLIYPKSKKICAIHAGWRGLANKIIEKSHKKNFTGDSNDIPFAFVGPHIQKESFEIEQDVLNELLNSVGNSTEFYESKNGKFLFDLNMACLNQLQALKIPPAHIYNSHLDTKTNLHYHSFRRDQSAAGRNVSFIARLF